MSPDALMLIGGAVAMLVMRHVAVRRELTQLRQRDYYRRRQAEAGKMSGEAWRKLRDTKTNQLRREMGL